MADNPSRHAFCWPIAENLEISYRVVPLAEGVFVVQTKRVLVVDDEKLVCDSCLSILSEEGYQVDTCLSARDSLRRLDRERFDMLVADLRMPDMDGIDLIERAKRKRPELAVVVITGYPSVETAVTTTKLGAAEYVPKPFTPDELAERVRTAFEKQ